MTNVDRTGWGPLESLATGRPIIPTGGISVADSQLMSELSLVNYEIAQYILDYCKADDYRTGGFSVEQEWSLAHLVSAAADAIEARARRREAEGDGRG
ncbi:hypothetical protein [Labedaea rhizosphaerae]|uniref:Uncharacterized protein n=1 Tax=Labedaea rhizosphaerae TaxID=598644 RepID=A0A4V6PVU4_LABRH|nr:hypothetical protein [Labedaea rhizosphaerae]TDP97938.1 hypothetical protein EV186_103918 [Labedaea rhizosphaerae]